MEVERAVPVEKVKEVPVIVEKIVSWRCGTGWQRELSRGTVDSDVLRCNAISLARCSCTVF